TRHDTDFHQFMLYTPIAGTPLHAELSEQGRMKDEGEYQACDIHGQYIFNYRHPYLTDEQAAEFIVRAFDRDFVRNGPSIVRIVGTTLAGWKRYKKHPDARIRRRFAWEARELGSSLAALVGGARLYYRHQPAMYEKLSKLLTDLCREFGWKARFFAEVGGRWLLRRIRREEANLADGWTYEPPTFYERNAAVVDNRAARLCQYIQPATAAQPVASPADAGA
ncbi:MAG: B12-binding domain-containing radical SAM protein, partial [Planctomycetes bacterium]|nr:B12-binding domain-containing radical SAM protein [Planctomycetota bacterium]